MNPKSSLKVANLTQRELTWIRRIQNEPEATRGNFAEPKRTNKKGRVPQGSRNN